MKFKVWEFGARYADEVVEIECESWREAAEACCSVNTETIVVEDESGQQKEYTVDPSIEWDVQLESVGHIEDRPTAERPRLWRVVLTSNLNYSSDGQGNDTLIAGAMTNYDATTLKIAMAAREGEGPNSPFVYMVVDDSYQLKGSSK